MVFVGLNFQMQFLTIKIKLFLRLLNNKAMINYLSTGVSATAKIYICHFTHRSFYIIQLKR